MTRQSTPSPSPSPTLAGLLAGALALLPAGAAAAPLRDLESLPVRILAGALEASGAAGGQYGLSAYTGGTGMQAIPNRADVSLLPIDGRRALPGLPRFLLRLHARDAPPTTLEINLTATNTRCMLTTIDPALNQASRPGRLLTITPRLLPSDAGKLPRLGARSSICGSDAGALTVYFSPPSFDMVEMTVVSTDATGYGSAASFITLPLPTVAVAKGRHP